MSQKPGPSHSGPGGQHPDAPPSYEDTMKGQTSGGGWKPPTSSAPGAQTQQNSGYPQSPPVVVHYVSSPSFGPHPVNMVCHHCQSQIRTSIDSEPGPMAWILAGILCVVGLWPCACLPCCIDSLNSVTHTCPNCNNYLGRYKGGM